MSLFLFFKSIMMLLDMQDEEVHLVYKSQLNDAPLDQLLVQYERRDAHTRYSNVERIKMI